MSKKLTGKTRNILLGIGGLLMIIGVVLGEFSVGNKLMMIGLIVGFFLCLVEINRLKKIIQSLKNGNQ